MAENLATYEGEDVADIIRDSVSDCGPSERLIFLMGPYRLLDPGYLYSETNFSLPSDPLAPTESTVDPDLIESTLREVADRISSQTPTTVFLASDIDIPTRREVAEKGLDEPGMPVIDQSVAFAKASAGNVFVFTKAGLTTGVGSETGAIPEYFDLRDPNTRSRDPRTFCILAEAERTGDEQNEYTPTFSSAWMTHTISDFATSKAETT